MGFGKGGSRPALALVAAYAGVLDLGKPGSESLQLLRVACGVDHGVHARLVGSDKLAHEVEQTHKRMALVLPSRHARPKRNRIS